MKFGLSDLEFDWLLKTIVTPLKKYNAKVYIFGSRANGKFKKFSDVDVLYIQDPAMPIPAGAIYNMTLAAENSHFPYKVDLVNYSELASSYKQNVDGEKIEI